MRRIHEKTIVILLVFLMSAGLLSTGTVSAADAPQNKLFPRFPFNDVPYDSWYFDSVWYVSENELMNGKGEVTFAPKVSMTRAEFITMLGRLYGTSGEESDIFDDVVKNSWYSQYVGWAYKSGVVNGFGDGTFRPNDPMTGEQMTSALTRFVTYSKLTLTENSDAPDRFTDADQISEWARVHIETLRKSGLIEGDNNGYFNPLKTMSRAEAATVLKRLDIMKKESNAPDYYAFGAYGLYCSGYGFTSGGNETVDESESYPLLKASTDNIVFDLRNMLVMPYKYPIFKICYSGGGESAALKLLSDSGEYSASLKAETQEISGTQYYVIQYYFNNLLTGKDHELCTENDKVIKLTLDFNTSDEIKIMYASFSKDAETADTLSAESLTTLLKTNPADSVKFEKTTDKLTQKYLDDAQNKINKIMNADGIDPKTIEKTCYYISSINGNDSNDGKSPSTPWKTLKNLYTTKAGGKIIVNVPVPGDGVFFERGSEFSAEFTTNLSGNYALATAPGVTYSAYGKGAKPLFTNYLKMKTPSGSWTQTEYDNVWRLDQTIPIVKD